nr:hypothetical protein [Melaminivora jejuensis]
MLTTTSVGIKAISASNTANVIGSKLIMIALRRRPPGSARPPQLAVDLHQVALAQQHAVGADVDAGRQRVTQLQHLAGLQRLQLRQRQAEFAHVEGQAHGQLLQGAAA